LKLDEILKNNIGKTIEITCQATESPGAGVTVAGTLKEVNDDYICLETPTGIMYINRMTTHILDFLIIKGKEK